MQANVEKIRVILGKRPQKGRLCLRVLVQHGQLTKLDCCKTHKNSPLFTLNKAQIAFCNSL